MTATSLPLAQREQALGACPVFSAIPAADLSLLAEIMQTETLRRGDVLFESGDVPDRIYVVVSGRLGVSPAGQEIIVRTLGPCQLLGEYGMFTNHARTATVRAQEDAVLMSLDYGRFRTYLVHCPEATLCLLATAVQRLVEAERRSAASQPTAE